jgi:hypothetical protein
MAAYALGRALRLRAGWEAGGRDDAMAAALRAKFSARLRAQALTRVLRQLP